MDTPLRIATYNASLNRGTQGALVNDLLHPESNTPTVTQAKTIAEIIQRAAPDIILINEFDFDPAAPALFRDNFLKVSQNGAPPIDYPYYFLAPSNTGVASGFDLNNNGQAVTTPGALGYGDDALGFGAFPGQFGMVIFSKYPIDAASVRTFQNFLWKDMPGARLPDDSTTPAPRDWYSPAELNVLPLSSKSHWDVPINVNGETVHVIAAHPTPPVFDGAEDRNGLRNADEIRFLADYVTPGKGGYIYDDQGRSGGLAPGGRFVVLGDMNSDPQDGDSVPGAIQQLLNARTVDLSITPTSLGAVEQAQKQGGANLTHKNPPQFDTADFADNAPGNLRADYVLPSQAGLEPINASVFWPRESDPFFNLVGNFNPALPGGFPSSDHKLVQLDLLVLDDAAFPQGVASGDTTQHSTVLWARSTEAGRVKFEWSTSPTFEHARSTTVRVEDTADPAKVEIRGLEAGTDYYFRAISPSGETSYGRFHTAAELGQHAGLHFGASGDWRGDLAPYPAVKNADDAQLDFFVELGDTIYADVPSPALPLPQAQTLDEFRIKHQEVYGDRGNLNTLADLRASTSVFAQIDDHEVTNDFAGGAAPSSDSRFAGTPGADFINETTLYKNGLQAFQEYNPMQERTWRGTGEDRFDGAPDLYRTQNYGSDAVIFSVDERSFRDQELANADPRNPADVQRFLAQSFDPSRTMLGDAQFERLKTDLLKAEQNNITWKFVMVPEPIQNLGPVAAADRYEGYAAERTKLLKFIDDNDIDNVVFITADIHGTLVNNLTYQLGPGEAQIALDAFEISTGAVAFSPELGPAIVGGAVQAGLLSPTDAAIYAALPVKHDADSVVDDKDDFIKALINSQLDQFGYDHIGLNDNLPGATGLVDATLLKGDYISAHTFGWTEFKIDPDTQILSVTTWGISSYATGAQALVAGEPQIVSQFTVDPDLTRTGNKHDDELAGGRGDDELSSGRGADTLRGREGDDQLDGGAGNDRLFGDQGKDRLIGGTGDDRLAGGADADEFAFTGKDLHGSEIDRVLDLNFAEGDRLILTDFTARTFAGKPGGNPLDVSDNGRAVTIDSFEDLVELDDASADVSIQRSGGDVQVTIHDSHNDVQQMLLVDQWAAYQNARASFLV
jgi:phosphodiesterase/alkaline phosphatase D-like protein